jgi:hypothetical protein
MARVAKKAPEALKKLKIKDSLPVFTRVASSPH